MVDSVLMLTTAGSRLSATLAKELESSTGEGSGRRVASGATADDRAARTPWDRKVPIRIPITSVPPISNAAMVRRTFMLIRYLARGFPYGSPRPSAVFLIIYSFGALGRT